MEPYSSSSPPQTESVTGFTLHGSKPWRATTSSFHFSFPGGNTTSTALPSFQSNQTIYSKTKRLYYVLVPHWKRLSGADGLFQTWHRATMSSSNRSIQQHRAKLS